MKTFEEANTEKGKERERGGEVGSVGGSVSERVEDLRERDYPRIFKNFDSASQRVSDRRDDVSDDFSQSIELRLEERTGINLQEIQQNISEIAEGGAIDLDDIDFSDLDQQDLFGLLITQVSNAALQMIAMSDQISGMAAIMNDIARGVQPPIGISVSGVNDTSSANVAEPLVEDSDDSEIDARLFKIKASSENDHPIWIGDDSVQVGRGIKLERGEEFPLRLDLREDQMYMISEEEGQVIEIMGLI